MKPDLEVLVGSRLYGVHGEDSDYDYLGFVVEPPEKILGFSLFEQEGGSDRTIYGLRKFCHLLLKGNPTLIETLWAPERFHKECSSYGRELLDRRHQFVSKRILRAYLGYMTQQKERLLGTRGQMDVKRKALVEKFGYDTKYAAHLIRLAIMGTILGRTGALQLPLAEKHQAIVLDIRHGGWAKEDVIILAENHEREMERLLAESHLPPDPDSGAVEQWMLSVYERQWREKGW